nr:hypothetical protein [Tanacetum cinerariifolium]
RLLDEQIPKRLHDEEVEQAAAREKQEKDDWRKKYQSLKRKPVSIAQARKNMIIYLKNMSGYKNEHFRDANEDITLVDMETQVDLGAELQGRIDDDNAATKEVNVVEPTVLDYEEVTLTMAQTLIKIKVEKARLLDEQIPKRLHDEEVEQAAAREKQEKDDWRKLKGYNNSMMKIRKTLTGMLLLRKFKKNILIISGNTKVSRENQFP